MELEQILKLIDAVSKSALTGFSLEEGETKLTLTADRVKEPDTAQQTGELAHSPAVCRHHRQEIQQSWTDTALR